MKENAKIKKVENVSNVSKLYFNNSKGITLVALVITIIILLILAGISIAQLSGNGLFENAKLAKEKNIKAEMVESLTLALQELHLEKRGKATIDDITQEWVDSKLKDYENTVKGNAENNSKTITMEKNNIIAKYVIDAKFGATEIPADKETIQFSYDLGEKNGDIVSIIIKVQDKINGLSKLEVIDTETIIDLANTKEEKQINYDVEMGKEYKVKITSVSGEVIEEKILIEKYYCKVTKKLSEGINIDNTVSQVEYDTSYQATITLEENYYLKIFTVTMGGENITVDKNTGAINIENVTGHIEIVAEAAEITTYLYNRGDECEDITGGWTGAYTGGTNSSVGSATKYDDYMELKTWGTWCAYAFGTNNIIDVSKISKIYIDCNIEHSNISYSSTLVAATQGVGYEKQGTQYLYIESKPLYTFNGILEVDVKDKTDNLNLIINTGNGGNIKINRVWVEYIEEQ